MSCYIGTIERYLTFLYIYTLFLLDLWIVELTSIIHTKKILGYYQSIVLLEFSCFFCLEIMINHYWYDLCSICNLLK